jgi:hypothetical protein
VKIKLLLAVLAALLTSCATVAPAPAPFAAKPKEPPRKAYVAGETFPDMTTRRPELVPQALPPRVRYRFSEGAAVNRLADLLRQGLATGDAALFSNVILVHPGAWAVLKERGKIAAKDSAEMHILNPAQIAKRDLGGGLAGKVLRSKDDSATLAKELSAMLSEDGSFEVRSFTSVEMAKWWVYIGFDIEEPVFVVTSNGGRYKFVIGFGSGDQVFIVDELNSLPAAA